MRVMDVLEGLHLASHFFFSMISVEEPTFQYGEMSRTFYLFLCQNTFLVEIVGIATIDYSWRYFISM
jgi:hypothetical protein